MVKSNSQKQKIDYNKVFVPVARLKELQDKSKEIYAGNSLVITL